LFFTPHLRPCTNCSLYTTNNSPPCRFINNEWVQGVDGKTFETINPSTEEVICSVHEATEKDVDIAVAAARKAFEGSWKKETPENRGKLLVKLSELIEKNLDLLAAVEALDNGKAIGMAKGDVAAVAGCLRYYGGWADKIEGKVLDTNPDTFSYTRQEPVCFPAVLQILLGS
jgi:aldehyde dehydrogenase (NAD+)